MTLRIENVATAVTMSGVGDGPIGADALGEVRDAVIACQGDRIAGVWKRADAPPARPGDEVIDARGAVAIPGLIDPHTHAVFAGHRARQFDPRARGMSYLDVARAGEGMTRTLAPTRAASAEELFALARTRLLRMLSFGVTTVEIKSGYGLDTAQELKLLAVADRLGRETPLTVVPTFMGAHVVPPEFDGRADDYVALVCDEMLPAVARQGVARFCDVFCEAGFFTPEQSRKILVAGREHGLSPKVHADEFTDLGGARLAAEVSATSADHLLHTGPYGVRALAASGTVAVLLPATAFFLGERYAPARALLDAGVPVALATDLNPGSCPTENPHLVLTAACTNMGMTVAEALAGMTVRAARALGLSDRGRLAPGSRADVALLAVPEIAYLPYHFGWNFVTAVIAGGRVALRRDPDAVGLTGEDA
jgi:imidazolonepropionase